MATKKTATEQLQRTKERLRNLPPEKRRELAKQLIESQKLNQEVYGYVLKDITVRKLRGR